MRLWMMDILDFYKNTDTHVNFLSDAQGTTPTGLLSNVSVFSYIINIYLIRSYIKPPHVVIVILSFDLNKYMFNRGSTKFAFQSGIVFKHFPVMKVTMWNIDLR